MSILDELGISIDTSDAVPKGGGRRLSDAGSRLSSAPRKVDLTLSTKAIWWKEVFPAGRGEVLIEFNGDVKLLLMAKVMNPLAFIKGHYQEREAQVRHQKFAKQLAFQRLSDLERCGWELVKTKPEVRETGA